MDALFDNDPGTLFTFAKTTYAIDAISNVAVALPKLSVLASYRETLTGKSYRIIIYLIAFIISANAIAGIVFSLVSCRPFSSQLNLSLLSSSCIDYFAAITWTTLPIIVTDVSLLLLALPTLQKLQLSKAQNVGAGLVLLTFLRYVLLFHPPVHPQLIYLVPRPSPPSACPSSILDPHCHPSSHASPSSPPSPPASTSSRPAFPSSHLSPPSLAAHPHSLASAAPASLQRQMGRKEDPGQFLGGAKRLRGAVGVSNPRG